MGRAETVILAAIRWKSMYLYKAINIPLNELLRYQLCANNQDSKLFE